MSTATSRPPLAGHSALPPADHEEGEHLRFDRPLDLKGRAVLLATDGSEPSVAAAYVARELAKQHHADVHVVSVVDTRSAPIPPPLDLALAIGDAVADQGAHAERNEEILADIFASLGEEVAWPVRTRLGTPASAIVHEARRLDAALIVLGLRQHHALARVLHDETALEVMRHASCPVLGVASTLRQLPRRILVAMDFSATSRLAAAAACGLAATPVHVVLAHAPPLTVYEPDDGARAIHDLGVDAAFMRTVSDLAAPHRAFDKVVMHHQTPGGIANLLLEAAEASKVELIATGSTRHGRIDRWIMGSVSTELVRDGRWSVLMVPPRDRR